MEGNGVTEKGVVIGLVASDIRAFQFEVADRINNFYSGYDPRMSLNREFILNLISKVHEGLDEILGDLI